MRKLSLFAILAVGCASGTTNSLSLSDADSESSTDVQMIDEVVSDGGTPEDNDIHDAGQWWLDVQQPDAGWNVDADPDKTYVSNSIAFVGEVSVGEPLGNAILSSDLLHIIQSAIAGGLPYDNNGVYYVFTSNDVSVDGISGFCYSYCSSHGNSTVIPDGGTNPIRFVFVGDVSNCEDYCAPFGSQVVTQTPNDWVAANMTNLVAQELAAVATDPDPISAGYPSWHDQFGLEMPSKCAWEYGTYYIAPGEGIYNVEFGGNKWLLQQLWTLRNADGIVNHCALDLNGDPGFDIDAAGPPPFFDAGYYEYTGAMSYLGGPVLNNQIHVYFIWYGNWASDGGTNAVSPVLQTFVNTLGASNWWAIVSQYFSEPNYGDYDSGVDASVVQHSIVKSGALK